MIQMNIHQISAIVGGNLVGKEARIQGVTTDSRSDCGGMLFVALKGAYFDGADYCQAAVDKGAAAVLVAHAVEVDVPQLIVKDTLVALQVLATAWIKQTGVKVVGITGSNGKTTVKNMLYAVLSQKYSCFATSGNYNNEIGVPLSLLSVRKEDDVAVIEMGAAQVGDIALLTEIIKPDIALVTNVGSAHVGRFGSEEQIATGKAEIYQALDSTGLAIINTDSIYADKFRQAVNCNVLTFGSDDQADFKLVEMANGYQVQTRRGEAIDFELPVLGRHNYINATAVIAIGLSMRLSVEEITTGLNQFKPEAGRLQLHKHESGLSVINDSYNANPASVNAAIDVLKTQSKPTLLIIGDMAELGKYSTQYHQDVGKYAKQQGIDQVIAVGEHAENVCLGTASDQALNSVDKPKDCYSFSAVEEVMTHLKTHKLQHGTVLVKGSRSMRLERVVDALINGKVA